MKSILQEACCCFHQAMCYCHVSALVSTTFLKICGVINMVVESRKPTPFYSIGVPLLCIKLGEVGVKLLKV